MALIPGVSRSGGTITAGLFLGLTRTAAVRYSFLLAIPAVVASGLFQIPDVFAGDGPSPLQMVVATAHRVRARLRLDRLAAALRRAAQRLRVRLVPGGAGRAAVRGARAPDGCPRPDRWVRRLDDRGHPDPAPPRQVLGQRRRGAGRPQPRRRARRDRRGAGGPRGRAAGRGAAGRDRQLADGALRADRRPAGRRPRARPDHRTRAVRGRLRVVDRQRAERRWPRNRCGGWCSRTRRPRCSPVGEGLAGMQARAVGRGAPARRPDRGRARTARGVAGLQPRRRDQGGAGRRAGHAPGQLPADHRRPRLDQRGHLHRDPAVRGPDQRPRR